MPPTCSTSSSPSPQPSPAATLPGCLATHLLHLVVPQLALPRQPLPQLVQGDVAVAVAVKRLEQLVQAVDLLVAAQQGTAGGHSSRAQQGRCVSDGVQRVLR